MKYKNTIKNEDGTPKLKELAESYDDGDKVQHLLKNTLGWDKEDVSTFQDNAAVHMKNLYGKIDIEIKELRTTAKRNAKLNAQHLSVFAFIGHGVINEQNEALFLVNSKNEVGSFEIKSINVDQLAKDFAEI